MNVLLAEDDPAHAAAIRRTLLDADSQIQVRVAGTLAAFRQAVAESQPDIAIMDLNLPDGCALEVLTSPPQDAPFPVLIMTSYGTEQVAVEALKAGALDYVVKSTEAFAGMLHTVERAMREWNLLQERKQTEETLRKSEENFRRSLDDSPLGVRIVTAAGETIYANRELLDFYGYVNVAEINHIPINERYIPQSYGEFKLRKKIRERGEFGPTEYEIAIVRKNGDIRQLRVFRKEVFWNHSKQFQVIYQDITEHKQAAEKRKNLEAQLLQSQKMEALGQLAGGVAHDFNNLLTGIRGFAQFALEQTPQDSSIREDLTEVLKLAKRAEALTRQLLAFSRKQPLQPEVLNINRTIEEMMKMLGRLIGENIDLVFVLAPDLGNVNVDPSQLEQVLANLALNARDAMPAGGKLTVETANVFLDQDYARANLGVTPGEYVMLAISDTGCGMDENIRKHIFEPFFTTKPHGKGTGLGLSTVDGIVNQLKGTIWVDSKPGQGTTIKIYQPRVVTETTGQEPAQVSMKTPRTKGTILIVEDDAVVLRIAQRAIEVCGYRVLTAASSPEADKVLAVHGESVDLILLDVVLPGCDGYQLFESLREKYPRLLVLYMSGYMDNAIVNKKILPRGIPFIQKPFTAETLALKVLEALGEKHHD